VGLIDMLKPTKKGNSGNSSGTNPSESEKRPLKTQNLSPPDYKINTDILTEACIEYSLCFLGIIPDVPSNIDPKNRTDILRCIDNAHRQGTLPRPSTTAKFDASAICAMNAFNIKILRYDSGEDLIVRVFTHEIASASYVNDDGVHYLTLKISAKIGPDAPPTGGLQSPPPARANEPICDLVILQTATKQNAEEICAVIGQIFQLVYQNATVQFLDDQIRHGAGYSDSPYSSYIRGGTTVGSSNTGSISSNHMMFHPSPYPSSYVDINSTWGSGNSSGSTMNGSHRGRTSSDSEMSSVEFKKLIEDFTKRLKVKLNETELPLFADCLTLMTTDFPNFLQKVYDLFGQERKYLLVEMRPFIPEQDISNFERFLFQKGVYDFHSPMFLQGVGMTEWPAGVTQTQQSPLMRQLQKQ